MSFCRGSSPPGIEPVSSMAPASQEDSLLLGYQGSPELFKSLSKYHDIDRISAYEFCGVQFTVSFN